MNPGNLFAKVLGKWRALTPALRRAIALTAVLLVFLPLVVRQVARFVNEWNAPPQTISRPPDYPAIDYCLTRSRLECILERTPADVKEWCAEHFDPTQRCDSRSGR
jgi:hypothetical protein